MLKENKLYTYIQPNEEFIKTVYYNGGFGNEVTTSISKKEEKITLINFYDCNYYLLENDFDVIDKLSKRKDEIMTLGLRKGLVNTLPKDQAKQYIDDIEKYEKYKLDSQISNLKRFLEDE